MALARRDARLASGSRHEAATVDGRPRAARHRGPPDSSRTRRRRRIAPGAEQRRRSQTSHVYARPRLRRAPAPTCACCVNIGPGAGRALRRGRRAVVQHACSDATRSSPRSSCCRSGRRSRSETLPVLARLQATEIDDWRDAQPGKILHELRTGELARDRRDPAHAVLRHGRRDAAVADAARRVRALDRRRRADRPPVAERARRARLDRQVRRPRRRRLRRVRAPVASSGLVNQGWKDSGDAIRFRDGTLAEAPIALVEVQGYVYAARLGIARLARLRGDDELADAPGGRPPRRCASAFEDSVLDGGRRAPTRWRSTATSGRWTAIASNAGHALWCGHRVAGAGRARRATSLTESGHVQRLGHPDAVARRWPATTPSATTSAAIWPHDNAHLRRRALRATGFRDEARARRRRACSRRRMYFRDARLPELFCGFDRADSPLPVPYPVACSPQAWAAGSLFQLLGAMLGHAARRRERRARAGRRRRCPSGCPRCGCENLRVGDAVVDLLVRRNDGSTGVEVLRRTGDLDVVVRRLTRVGRHGARSTTVGCCCSAATDRLRAGGSETPAPRRGAAARRTSCGVDRTGVAGASRGRRRRRPGGRSSRRPWRAASGASRWRTSAASRSSTAWPSPSIRARSSRGPETEPLVELASSASATLLTGAPRGRGRAAAAGSGTWARAVAPIAVALAVELRRRGYGGHVRLLATDSRATRSRVAIENAVGHGVADVIDFATGDLLAVEPPAAGAGRPAAGEPALHPERRAADAAGCRQLRAAAGARRRPGRPGPGPPAAGGLPAARRPGGSALLEIGADQARASWPPRPTSRCPAGPWPDPPGSLRPAARGGDRPARARPR